MSSPPSQIDRLAPTYRPDRPAVGLQRWRQLLFLHWPVPVAALRPLIPGRLAIDTFEGEAYVGVIPFTIDGTRPLKVLPPVPTASRFHELNVRTYVHLDGRDPGVWFFSLDAASTLAVIGARLGYALPYYRARMSLEQAGSTVRYRSRRIGPGRKPATIDLRYEVGGELETAKAGTLEHFLVERYVLYTTRGGGLVRARVHHRAYPLRRATVVDLGETMVAAAGLERGRTRTPDLFSPGVDVEIFAPERV